MKKWKSYLARYSIVLFLIFLVVTVYIFSIANQGGKDIEKITISLAYCTHIQIEYRVEVYDDTQSEFKNVVFSDKEKIQALAFLIAKTSFSRSYMEGAIASQQFFTIFVYNKETVLCKFSIVMDNGFLHILRDSGGQSYRFKGNLYSEIRELFSLKDAS